MDKSRIKKQKTIYEKNRLSFPTLGVGETLAGTDGFSLTEMLATVLIMSLVTMAIATGITTAVRVYRQITLKADAQTLLATSIAALNADFSTADTSLYYGEDNSNPGSHAININTDQNEITFYSVNRGYQICIRNDADNGQILAGLPKKDGDFDDSPLVTVKTRTFDLHTKISGISINPVNASAEAMEPESVWFSYTISVYSGDSVNSPIEERTVTVNDIF